MDYVPVERPRPHLRTLTLLVGRVTTIKLAYWAGLTVFELLLPRFSARPVDERLPISYAAVATGTALALAWAVRAARAGDRGHGPLTRSLPTIAVTFVAATVVASPASIPLLLIELQRSLEGCAPQTTCHAVTIVLWVAVLAIGTLLIPAAFAAALRPESKLDR